MKEHSSNPEGRATLAVAIIAKDEEQNLKRTLESVAFADEILLVDSGSTDGTLTVAREAGATVYSEPWHGFAGQKNFAIDQCTKDWVLSLDADEVVTPELREEIKRLLSVPPGDHAFSVGRRNYFLGRWLRHGGLYPDPKLRLFRRGVARFEERPVHETVLYSGPTIRLEGDLIHHAYPTLELYLEHMNRYSTASVPLALGQGKSSLGLLAFLFHTLLNPAATFVYNYVLRLGFLDGREGLLFHLYHSMYVNWKYVKAWQASRAATLPPLPPSS